jgi:peptidylprolyl isomerase
MFCLSPSGEVRPPLLRLPYMLPPPMARLVALLALLAAVGLTACGDDDDSGGGGGGDSTPAPTAEEQTETEPSISEQRAALEDTSTKPVIPRPTGSPPRRLEMEDIVRGKGRAAKAGDTVLVHYAGVTFSTGEEFDASWNTGQPFPFPLGGGQVIEGWDRGIVGMKVGGRRMLTIPPELAYGSQGFPPAIGPNETLVFVVDLLEIQ